MPTEGTESERDTRVAAQDSAIDADFGTVAAGVEYPDRLQVEEIPPMNRKSAGDLVDDQGCSCPVTSCCVTLAFHHGLDAI